AAVTWLKQIVLPEIDRLEMNHLLIDLEHVQQRMKELEKVIAQRSGGNKEVAILSSIPGMGRGFTAMSLACRIGRVERFPRGPQPGQLLGPNAWMPQQRRERSAFGQNHQGR